MSMNYRALFSAIRKEIAARKLSVTEVDKMAGGNGNVLNSALLHERKLSQQTVISVIANVVSMFRMDLSKFADMNTIGGRIEYLQIKNGLNSEMLAKKVSCSKNAVARWKSGRYYPSEDHIKKISTEFNVTVDFITGRDNLIKKPVRNALVDLPSTPIVERVISKSTHKHEITTPSNDSVIRCFFEMSGGYWFCAMDFCHAFGIQNGKQTILDLCNSSQIKSLYAPDSNDNVRNFVYINTNAAVLLVRHANISNEAISNVNYQKLNYELMKKYSDEVELRIARDAAKEKEPTPLVPIVVTKIGSEEVNSISARDLYLDLGLSAPNWAAWSKTNIAENEFFKLNTDFISLMPVMSETNKGNHANDYAVTIEFAKHIAMMAKTKRAHDYRNYFIECEKVALGERAANNSINHLSQEVIATLRQARTVQLAMGMTKTQSSQYARDLIKDRFGFDMELATTGICNKQLGF